MPRTESNYARASADAALGAYLASIAPELLTGRTTLYHGTSPKRAAQIRKGGLAPGARQGIVEMLDPAQKGPPATYLTRNRAAARGYGMQTDALEKMLKQKMVDEGVDPIGEHAFMRDKAPGLIRDWAKDPEKRRSAIAGGRGEVLKLRVPTWSYEQIDNPEVSGQSRRGYVQRGIDDAKKRLGRALTPLEGIAGALNRSAAYSAHKRDFVTPDRIGADRIVGHPSFKKLGLAELAEYIKHKPKRFGGGITAAAGVPLLAYDAYQALRGREIGP